MTDCDEDFSNKKDNCRKVHVYMCFFLYYELSNLVLIIIYPLNSIARLLIVEISNSVQNKGM